MAGPIMGSDGNDRLVGTAGNDVLFGSLGTDTVDGGAGYDVLRFDGLPANYFYSGFSYQNGSATLDEVGRLDTRGGDNVTTFHNVERIEFLDAVIELSGASITAQVNNLYLGLLGRDADLAGLSYWTHQATEMGIASVATTMVNSAEFTGSPTTTDSLVIRLYENVLGRTPTGSDITYWNGVADQQGLAAVSFGIAASDEAAIDPLGLARAGLPIVDLDGTWIGFSFNSLLGRQADLGGFRYFLDAMHNGLDERGVVNTIVSAQEFQTRVAQLDNGAYVDLLYEEVLHRDADADGKAWHVSSLDAGAGRDQVAFSFLASEEAAPYLAVQIYTGNVALPSDII